MKISKLRRKYYLENWEKKVDPTSFIFSYLPAVTSNLPKHLGVYLDSNWALHTMLKKN